MALTVMALFLCLIHAILPAVFSYGLEGNEVRTRPEQVHLSLTGDVSEMMVTWVTQDLTSSSTAEYGLSSPGLKWPSFDHSATGTTTKFIDGGQENRTIYVHRVRMAGLKPNQKYAYHVGGAEGWSEIYFFQTFPDGTDWSPSIAVYGDMGNKNAQSLPRLQEETQRGRFDAIFHVGDFAYDMSSDNGRVGDEFMRQIESIAAYLPYMTCPGNHESHYNFSNYKNRFTMPGGDGEGMFYSFNVGPVHVMSFSSEFYYYLQYGFRQLVRQYQWMEQDLWEANLPENRAKRPWIITMCHRPMYCSNSDEPGHCTNMENKIRTGINLNHDLSPERLLYKYGVDLHIQAHEHSYERMWPVYDLTVCNGSVSEPYRNPEAPVHIVTGSSGCQEGLEPFFPTKMAWSAFHTAHDYGFTRLKVANATHLYLEQVSDNKGGKVIDRMTLIKERHGQYNCHLQNKPQHKEFMKNYNGPTNDLL